MSFDFDKLLRWIWHILTSCSLLVTLVSYLTDLLRKLNINGVGDVTITFLTCLHLQHLLLVKDFVGAMFVFFNCLWQAMKLLPHCFFKTFKLLTILLNLLIIFLRLLDQRQVLLFKLDKVRFELLRCLERQRIGLIRAIFEEKRLQGVRVLNFILGVPCAVGFTTLIPSTLICLTALRWNRPWGVDAGATPTTTIIKWLCITALAPRFELRGFVCLYLVFGMLGAQFIKELLVFVVDSQILQFFVDPARILSARLTYITLNDTLLQFLFL